jgi:putative tryptophan/tyrosine transport system substrate-binding protein
MQRREFIAGLGGAAAWPLAARAQPRLLPVIGMLITGRPGENPSMSAFHRGLGEAGYVEGRNVAIEYRWSYGPYGDLPAMASDLVGRGVAVIVAIGAVPATLAAKAATATIPVVFSIGTDPIRLGLVASLNRPGGNLTGVANLNTELMPKRLELLHELAPGATDIAALFNPTNPAGEIEAREVQAAADALGLRLHVLHASGEGDLETVFATLTRLGAGGLVIGGDSLFVNQRAQIAALALHHRLPAIFFFREFALSGGLMTYGTNPSDQWRMAGVYPGRILKGEKPADLPVQQATKVELIINLKTAKALGLTIPQTLLGRADEVIE